jgi:hypothetical protein
MEANGNDIYILVTDIRLYQQLGFRWQVKLDLLIMVGKYQESG